MADLQSIPAKICYTATAFCIHQGKIILIEHKKLGLWLAPGGHIEPNELPHHAAEREFFEETNLKAKAVQLGFAYNHPDQKDEYLPNPFSTNLHWVSQENYQSRITNPTNYHPISPWDKGCEQHISFIYLVKLIDPNPSFQINDQESINIGWFTLAEIQKLNTTESIKAEAKKVIELSKT